MTLGPDIDLQQALARRPERVGVGSPAAPHSSVWRFYVTGDGFYALALEGRRLAKFSLHESGRWRFATLEGVAAEGSDRVLWRWSAPDEHARGWTRYFEVRVPWVDVETRMSLPFSDGRTQWLGPPTMGMQRVIAAYRVAPGAMATPPTDVTIVGSIPLRTLGTMLVFTRVQPLPEPMQRWLATRPARVRADPASSWGSVLEFHGDEHPIILNYVLGEENFEPLA